MLQDELSPETGVAPAVAVVAISVAAAVEVTSEAIVEVASLETAVAVTVEGGSVGDGLRVSVEGGTVAVSVNAGGTVDVSVGLGATGVSVAAGNGTFVPQPRRSMSSRIITRIKLTINLKRSSLVALARSMISPIPTCKVARLLEKRLLIRQPLDGFA